MMFRLCDSESRTRLRPSRTFATVLIASLGVIGLTAGTAVAVKYRAIVDPPVPAGLSKTINMTVTTSWGLQTRSWTATTSDGLTCEFLAVDAGPLSGPGRCGGSVNADFPHPIVSLHLTWLVRPDGRYGVLVWGTVTSKATRLQLVRPTGSTTPATVVGSRYLVELTSSSESGVLAPSDTESVLTAYDAAGNVIAQWRPAEVIVRATPPN